jgi:hypothetical protein
MPEMTSKATRFYYEENTGENPVAWNHGTETANRADSFEQSEWVNREGCLRRTHGMVLEEVLELRFLLARQFMKFHTTAPHTPAVGVYLAAYFIKQATVYCEICNGFKGYLAQMEAMFGGEYIKM